ncbi:MAG: D-hexose-6-phosphate mutarotase [Georgenia sp.]
MTAELAIDLPDSVTISEGAGGLRHVDVTSPVATGEIYLHGAHVTAYTPAGQDPVIWMSKASMFEEERPIRGGVPICFPWFGGGRDPGMEPAHGFARLVEWDLVGADDVDGVITLTLRLTGEDVAGLPATQAWPHAFDATYTVTFGPELGLDLTVRNPGDRSYSFEEALHSYLHVKDVTVVTVDGLDGATYRDKAPGAGPEPVTQSGAVTFAGETDRVYTSSGTAVVRDPGLGRTLTVAKQGSANTVVWNPWVAKAAAMPDFDDDEWPTMVCVETANADVDAVTLEPGQSHTMVARIAAATS